MGEILTNYWDVLRCNYSRMSRVLAVKPTCHGDKLHHLSELRNIDQPVLPISKAPSWSCLCLFCMVHVIGYDFQPNLIGLKGKSKPETMVFLPLNIEYHIPMVKINPISYTGEPPFSGFNFPIYQSVKNHHHGSRVFKPISRTNVLRSWSLSNISANFLAI